MRNFNPSRAYTEYNLSMVCSYDLKAQTLCFGAWPCISFVFRVIMIISYVSTIISFVSEVILYLELFPG